VPDKLRPQPLFRLGQSSAAYGSGACLCYAHRRLGDEVLADHPRFFGRDPTIYDPWHYLPVLVTKPGALRNGAPFQDWKLPPALSRLRRKLGAGDDADRRFVRVLAAVLDDGLDLVEPSHDDRS
jgi:hypothetical protein